MDKTTLKQKVAQAIKEMNKYELLGLYDDFVNETSYGDGYIYETAIEFNSHFQNCNPIYIAQQVEGSLTFNTSMPYFWFNDGDLEGLEKIGVNEYPISERFKEMVDYIVEYENSFDYSILEEILNGEC